MKNDLCSVITGTGSYIPPRKISKSHFLTRTFLDASGAPFERNNTETLQKFEEITGIRERRYLSDDLLTSDMGTMAAERALEASGTDRESLDYIIVAHNFGDVRAGEGKMDMVPTLASRVKQKLGIRSPWCVAYDLPFGCPGWVQGVIQANYYLRSGDANRVLVIGAETLSRVSDPYDRDSLIYADGAGAAVLEARKSKKPTGILSHVTRTDTETQLNYLQMDHSFSSENSDALYLKMEGRKLYQYALMNVPGVVKLSLEKAGVSLGDVKKVLIHQANEKMDEAILERIFKLYDSGQPPEGIMPMTISRLGNSSVATVPTLLDLILRDEMDGHSIDPGDIIVLASVGAGMNINSIVYRA